MKYMLASGIPEIAKEWEKYRGFTIRPLPSTLSYYGEIIAAHSEKTRFLLYGGTPEIRSIFQKLHYPLTLIDRSRAMVRAMGLLTDEKLAFSPRESFLQQDWLNLDALEEQFDLLIGDDAINMVPWTAFDLFLKHASRRLRPGGLFICHLLVKPDDDLIQMELSQLETEFRQGAIRTSYDLASRLNFLCWDPKTYGMGWQRTIKQLGDTQLARFLPEFNFVDTFGLCNSHFYCPPLEQFSELVERYFHVRDVFYPNEHAYCRFEPVYVLEKK